MATIINFKDFSQQNRKSGPQPMPRSPAQLFLFTGVRYERAADPAPAAQPPRRARKMVQRRSQQS